jgi:hypothetical protein
MNSDCSKDSLDEQPTKELTCYLLSKLISGIVNMKIIGVRMTNNISGGA